MEQQPISQEWNLAEFAAESAQAIEREFNRTQNSWLACYGTRIFVIETRLYPPTDTITQRLEDAKIRLQYLHAQYPEESDIPPVDIQTDMLSRLDVLAVEYPPLLDNDQI